MRNFYINNENKLFSFSEKNKKLICLGQLIGETADHLYCASTKYNHIMFSYNKKVRVGGYYTCYPQEYRDLKICLSKYNKPFKSILRPIDEYYQKVA